jgi:hypothetical protein
MKRETWLVALLCLAGCGGGDRADTGEGQGGTASSGAGDTASTGTHREKPDPIDPRHEPGDCALETPAFCERFDEPHRGGYAGDLDEAKWSLSRWTSKGSGFLSVRANSDEKEYLGINQWSNPDGAPVLCGKPFQGILPPDDAVVCDGQFNDVMMGEGLPINSFMIRQPFDFTDRTGTVVFDVDAKRNDGFDGHGWWLEVWITDEPVPIPYHEAPTVASIPRNGVGIQIAPFNDAIDVDPQVNQVNGVNGLVVARDGKLIRDTPFGGIEGPTFRVKDQHLNRFKLQISKDHIEIWTSHWDEPDKFLPSLRVDDIDLGFTWGYVHFQHVHYNPPKVPNCNCDPGGDCGPAVEACWDDPPPGEHDLRCCWANPDGIFASPAQVYRWDNIGFDGPTLPTPRAYVVPPRFEYGTFEDDGKVLDTVELGYQFDSGLARFDVTDVDLRGALYATFNFDVWSGAPSVRVRFNGSAWHEVPTFNPDGEEETNMHAFVVDAPLEELVSGTNRVEIQTDAGLGNLSLTVYPQ